MDSFDSHLPATTSGLKLPVAAIEVGYGDTKSAYRNAMRKVVLNAYPSLTPTYSKKTISNSLGKASSTITYQIDVGDVQYEVGPDVMTALGGTINIGRNVGERFPETPEYEALVLGAIAQMGATHIGHLVLGLPVHNMQKYAQFLMLKFSNSTFMVCGRKVTINRVTVLPQPIGTLIYISAKKNRALVPGEIRLIIDPGYYSTDWIVADGFKIHEKRSSGTVCGVSHLLTEACKHISAKLGLEFSGIERLGVALRDNTNLRVAKNELSNAELWSFINQSSNVINECLRVIESSVGSMMDISEVHITGGGGIFFSEICKNRYKDQSVELLDDSRFVNAMGFLFQGEN